MNFDQFKRIVEADAESHSATEQLLVQMWLLEVYADLAGATLGGVIAAEAERFLSADDAG